MSAAASMLMGRGVFPLELVPTDAGQLPDRKLSLSLTLFADKIAPVDILLFTRQLGTLLKSGVPILQALGGLQQSAVNPAFVKVLERLGESLASGHEFSAALGRETTVFSPFYVAMVRVGESTGRLDEVLARLHEHLEFEQYMSSQVKSALRYPTFVGIAILVAIGVINLMVVPAFAKVFKTFNAELPLLTRFLIASSDFMLGWWWFIGLATGACYMGWRSWLATAEGRMLWDRHKLRIPIAGSIVMKATIARFARSFALAARSGVPLVSGLSLVARTVDNEYVGSRIERMREGVSRGESVLRTAHASGVFTPVALQMMAIGEESGALDGMLGKVADFFEAEVDDAVEALSSLMEPMIMVVLGTLIGGMVIAMYLPIFKMGQAV